MTLNLKVKFLCGILHHILKYLGCFLFLLGSWKIIGQQWGPEEHIVAIWRLYPHPHHLSHGDVPVPRMPPYLFFWDNFELTEEFQ